MKLLFIGDIVGKPGRQSVRRWLPGLKDEFGLDFVVANAENSAGGLGATPETIDELTRAGVDAFTMGNHTWRKRTIVDVLDRQSNIVRPANYPAGAPGRGFTAVPSRLGVKVGLVNVLGRVYMEPLECPFEHARRCVDALKKETPVILVDIHAEATSEKIAMGWFLDGHVSAVVGTHTHVQTADERVLPGGAAFICDVGMTGPFDSVIGSEKDRVIRKFITAMPNQFQVAAERPGLNAVVIDIDETNGKARSIERVQRFD